MLKLYNSLTRKKEIFEPLNPPNVNLYTCGPTVYDYQHIGNWRTFLFEDTLRRVLELNGYKVNHVMNATDVGHLSGDNLGDADTGVDRMEKGAKREGKSVWDVAKFYLDDFVKTRDWLNILPPTHFVRATDYVKEQIKLVQKLIEKGFAYETETGIFFDVTKFPDYGELGGQKLIDKRTAFREEVEEDKFKRNPQDFALWFKTVGKFASHEMRWVSPWGEGFPGWHIECSAMAMSILGETIDIHTGGVDHIAIHHTNEIAQSEGATGKSFSKYWLHGEFLIVDGGRMGKSLGNAYTLHDIKEKKIDLLALRYLFLTASYRDQLNFTWDSLEGAQTALERLKKHFQTWACEKENDTVKKNDEIFSDFKNKFTAALNDNLNTAKVIALVWDIVKADLTAQEKFDLVQKFDQVLGLDLRKVSQVAQIPQVVEKLVQERDEARNEKNFVKADKFRKEIENLGYTLKDTDKGTKLTKL